MPAACNGDQKSKPQKSLHHKHLLGFRDLGVADGIQNGDLSC